MLKLFLPPLKSSRPTEHISEESNEDSCYGTRMQRRRCASMCRQLPERGFDSKINQPPNRVATSLQLVVRLFRFAIKRVMRCE